jgi:chromosome segregation ATPase
LVAGCRNRELEQAQQDAREAKATINKLNYNLKSAVEEIATVKAELAAVRQDRDLLQKQKDQLVRERDQASTSAQQAQEAVTRLTTQTTGQGTVAAALQKQIAELGTLVEDQRKLIEQLQKGATAPTADKPTAPDPNTRP